MGSARRRGAGVVLAAVLAAACSTGEVPAGGQSTSSTSSTPAGAGIEHLFDGTPASFERWRQAGPGGFDLDDGMITSRGGMGLLWYPEPVGDGVLRLQWRTEEATDNSGVFVGLGDPGEDMLAAMRAGHEVQIYDADTGEPQKTGAIYNADPADAFASRPPGTWNDLVVSLDAGTVEVELNGEAINSWTDPDGAHTGFIGLQNHADADVVSFRDVRLERH